MESVIPRRVLRRPTTLSDYHQLEHTSTGFLAKDDVVETLPSPLWPAVTDPYHDRLAFGTYNGCPPYRFPMNRCRFDVGFLLSDWRHAARTWMDVIYHHWLRMSAILHCGQS